MKIAVVIPAYNEEFSIAKTVEGAKRYCDVIVIDDCSKDQTRSEAQKHGAMVYSNPVNKGYDETIDTGFKKALELGYSHVITFDADGQHPHEALGSFVEGFNKGYDLVLGVRHRYQRFSESLFALYTKRKFGVSDPLSGLKGYSLDYYKRVGHFDSFKSIGTELALTSLSLGASFTQVPYHMHERESGQPKFGSVLRANYKILSALCKSIRRY